VTLQYSPTATSFHVNELPDTTDNEGVSFVMGKPCFTQYARSVFAPQIYIYDLHVTFTMCE